MNEKLTQGERVGKEFTDMQGTPYVMQRETWLSSRRSPCTAPPFGTLTAVSLQTGKTLWDVPLGTDEGLDKIGLPKLPADSGMVNLGGAITTAGGLVFIGATLDAYVRAFDVETGRELWKFKLPAGGKATPMTYLRRGWPSVRRDLGGWRWQGLGKGGFDHGVRASEGASLRG